MAQRKKAPKSATPFPFQYTAKFLCTATIPGTSQTAASLPAGQYSTIVNIHNPHERRVKMQMKIAVPGLKPSKFKGKVIGPDHAVKVGCDQILRDFGITFIHGAEGFLVVESTHSVDVTAVYTAASLSGEVVSLDVEPVRERVLR